MVTYIGYRNTQVYLNQLDKIMSYLFKLKKNGRTEVDLSND